MDKGYIMIGYKDRTFCRENECRLFNDCHRALTEEVREGARLWWGSDAAPICTFTDVPVCFEGEKEQ